MGKECELCGVCGCVDGGETGIPMSEMQSKAAGGIATGARCCWWAKRCLSQHTVRVAMGEREEAETKGTGRGGMAWPQGWRLVSFPLDPTGHQPMPCTDTV